MDKYLAHIAALPKNKTTCEIAKDRPWSDDAEKRRNKKKKVAADAKE